MDIAPDVAAHLRRLVCQGNESPLSIADAASSLGLSVRTLQRRLADSGLTYRKLLDRVRLEEACRLIMNSDARLTEVAYQLGFSGPSHFSRAFRRWIGMAPQQFRQRIRHERGEAQSGSRLAAGHARRDGQLYARGEE